MSQTTDTQPDTRLLDVRADLAAATEPNETLLALAEAERVAANATRAARAAAASENLAKSEVHRLSRLIALSAHEHTTDATGVVCTACGERRAYRWAGSEYRYAYLSETLYAH